jgi:phenylalanyl-tRNA synthetase beta chain
MICAEDELGLGKSHDGILVLPADYKVGEKASNYFPIYSDYLIEIGLTANRGDAASHKGVARDLRALTSVPLKNSNLKIPKSSGTNLEFKISNLNFLK